MAPKQNGIGNLLGMTVDTTVSMKNLPTGCSSRKRPMNKVNAITKRDFPTMARVLYDFEQEFGLTERTFMQENGTEYGEPWQGAGVVPVLEVKRK